MSSTGIRKRRTTDDRTDDTVKQVEDGYIRKAKRFTDQARAETGNVGPAAIGGPSIPGASYLPISGKYGMIGSIAFNPIVVAINDGRINVTPNQSGASKDSSYVLVLGQGTPDDLRFIDGASKNGQVVWLQGTQTQIINLKAATIPSISLISGLVIVTVVTTTNHNLTTGDKINILETNNFNINDVDVTVIDPTTFTYTAIGSVLSESSGTVQDGNFITETGDDVILDGTKAPHGTGIIPIIFDATIVGNGAWRPAQTLTAGSGNGGGGDLSEPVELGVNEVTTQTLPTKTIVSGDIFNPAHIILDKDIDIQLDISTTTGKYKSIFIIFDTTGGGNTVTWPTSVVNPPIIKDGKVERISVHLFTINNGVLWTFATTVGSSSVGLQKLSELEIDVNKDWQALGISNFGPLTGVTTMAMVGTSPDITGVNQISMTGTLPKIQGIEEMDFDGTVAKIQGLHTIEFNRTNTSIDDEPGGIGYTVDENDQHRFKSVNGDFLILDEVNPTDRRIDVKQNRIVNIGKLSFTETFEIHVAGFAEIFTTLSDQNIRYISKNSHIFEVDGQTQPLLTIGNFAGLGGALQDIASLNLNDATFDPSFNGEFQMNGIDVKVVSGGIVRNLSNISDGPALETDLSNMVSPTLPTVDLSLNTHQLTNVTNVIMIGATTKIDFPDNALDFISADSSGITHSLSANKKHDFFINGVSVFRINQTAALVTIDAAGNDMLNILSLSSNTPNRPGSGFIRMASSDEIRMRNPSNTDDLIITSGNDALNNQAILFQVAGGDRLTVSQFAIDVIQNNIINTGDILPSGTGGEVGDSVNFYNQMHSQFFIAEGATPVTNRFGMSKTGNVVYMNFDDNHTDAGFGIFEQGIRHFLFSRTGSSPFVNEFAIAGTGALAGETYKIQMGNTGDNSASISLIEGDTFDLIINRAFSVTTPQTTGVQLQANGITTLLSNNIETKFFSNVNINSNNLDGVKSVFADASALATIGEFQPSNGGFNYILRDRMSWESNFDTYIEMNVNELSIISDADIKIQAFTTNSDINVNVGSTGTLNLGVFATTFLQIDSGVMTFSGGNLSLTNGAEYISFLDATSGDSLDVPNPDHINLFNDINTGELSVKKSDGSVLSLEGAGNLNTDLSNMVSPTLPTVDLSLNTHKLTDVTEINMVGADPTINNVGIINFSTGLIQGLDDILATISNQGISFDSTGSLYFVPQNRKHEFGIGGDIEMEIRETGNLVEIDMKGNIVLGFKDIRFDSTATFTATSSNAIGADVNGMILNVPNDDDYNFRVGNNNIVEMSETAFTISSATTLINSSTINFGDNATDSINFIGEIQIAPTYRDGVRQTFNPNGTRAGLNFGSQPNPEPTAPINGDAYYNSTLNKFRVRENSEWQDLVGANQLLNNLTGTPTLNLNVFPNRTTGGNLGGIGSSEAFRDMFTDKITFVNDHTLILGRYEIGKAPNHMVFNIPQNADFQWFINQNEEMVLDNISLNLAVDLDLLGNTIIMGGGGIAGLSSIIFDNNFTISTGVTSLVIDSLNASDTFNFRQGGNNRLTFDNLGSVELSGGPTGATRLSVNNGNFTVFAAANGGDTEFICQSNTSLVFKENTVEVARFDGGVNDWLFSPLSSFKVVAGGNVELTAISGNIALTADGVVFVNSDLDMTGNATIDFGANLVTTSANAGNADTVPNKPTAYINVKIDGAIGKIAVFLI